MSIKFSDNKGTIEEAVDLGGPIRVSSAANRGTLQSGMFEGREGHLNLALDSTGLYTSCCL